MRKDIGALMDYLSKEISEYESMRTPMPLEDQNHLAFLKRSRNAVEDLLIEANMHWRSDERS